MMQTDGEHLLQKQYTESSSGLDSGNERETSAQSSALWAYMSCVADFILPNDLLEIYSVAFSNLTQYFTGEVNFFATPVGIGSNCMIMIYESRLIHMHKSCWSSHRLRTSCVKPLIT